MIYSGVRKDMDKVQRMNKGKSERKSYVGDGLCEKIRGLYVKEADVIIKGHIIKKSGFL